MIRILLLWVATAGLACAQDPQFPNSFPTTLLEDDAILARAMPAIAQQALDHYRESDQAKYLDTVFKLQLVAGRYSDAVASMRRLREMHGSDELTRYSAINLQFEMFALAKIRQVAEHHSFEEAFKQVFQSTVGVLDAVTAANVISSFGRELAPMEEAFNTAVMSRRDGRAAIALTDALDLVAKYQAVQAYEAFRPLTADLIADDDRRRYVIDDNVAIPTADGAVLRAIVIRPRVPDRPATTLMALTIYAGSYNYWEARRGAAHGYATVIAYIRGKGGSPGAAVPYERDGDDAVAVINWIARQPWSDGRVGMYGGSYSGGAAWAAAKRRPPALKALMASVPVIPGLDVPMEGNVFQGFVYSWPLYTTSGPWLDDTHYGDRDRWNRLFRTWYQTGQAYSALDHIDGTPNPFFHRWLSHPAYDEYWQAMAPSAQDYARISIPILETAGFLEGQSLTVPYHFSEHLKRNPKAKHFVVLGPYDHIGAQRRPAEVVGGYQIDPVARINIEELRYQWFDYVLKGAHKPELLADRVNYEVMGANVWKHAPSLAAMSNGSLRFYLANAASGQSYKLSASAPGSAASITHRANFSDRSDVDRAFPASTLDRTLDSANGVVFVSDPIDQVMDVSGQFAGKLEFTTNKRDFDLNVGLYELLPGGEYFALSYYLIRASYAGDLRQRHLLTPGQLQEMAFKTGHVTSKRLSVGSRLVLVLNVVKQVDLPVNYGSGKDVSEETIADAGAPLEIEWHTNSYVDIPTWH